MFKELFIGEIRPQITDSGSSNRSISVTADPLSEKPQSDYCDINKEDNGLNKYSLMVYL